MEQTVSSSNSSRAGFEVATIFGREGGALGAGFALVLAGAFAFGFDARLGLAGLRGFRATTAGIRRGD